MIQVPHHLIPVYNVCLEYCSYTSDRQLEELVDKLKADTLTDKELALFISKLETINNQLDAEYTKIANKIGLDYSSSLTCDNEKFIRCIQIMFTYLSSNSNIIMTNCLNNHLNLSDMNQSITDYLLTREDSLLPVLRYQVADFVKSYRKPNFLTRTSVRLRRAYLFFGRRG